MPWLSHPISVLGASGTSWSAGGDAGAPSCKRIPSARCVCSVASSPAPRSLITWCLIAATGTPSFTGELQSLCATCHNSSKRLLDHRGYLPDVAEDGWPTDPRHPANKQSAAHPCRSVSPGGRRRKFYLPLPAARRPFHVESCEIAICTGILFPKSCSSQSFRSAESGDAHRLP